MINSLLLLVLVVLYLVTYRQRWWQMGSVSVGLFTWVVYAAIPFAALAVLQPLPPIGSIGIAITCGIVAVITYLDISRDIGSLWRPVAFRGVTTEDEIDEKDDEVGDRPIGSVSADALDRWLRSQGG